MKTGTYRHFKGGLYEVIETALHSETKEELVVYRATDSGKFWVRPKQMFEEKVLVDGKEVLRFTLVDEEAKIILIREAQELVRIFAARNHWEDFPNIDKFDHLHEELIEMSQYLRYKNKEECKKFVEENKIIFVDGIGDLFFGLCRLANQLSVDVEGAFNFVRKEIFEKYNHQNAENNLIRE